jgi:hypothetical protein
MSILEVALAEWLDSGCLLVLGRTTDPAIVRAVREHLAASHRLELARLDPGLRLAPASPPEGSDPA